jgi:hypothetical protein
VDIPEDFDLNGFQILGDFFGNDFEEHPNELGGSDSDKALRQIIDSKINLKESFLTLKKLIGKMVHYFLQQKKSVMAMVKLIYKQTGIKATKVRIEAYKRKCLNCGYEDKHKEEERPRADVCPICGCSYFTRHHVDILTDKYVIEIKTSLMYVRDFERQISNKYAKQTNYYMGAFEPKLGYVLYLNLAAFKNKFTSWDEIWLKYGYCIPMDFNQKMYDKTIKKFKKVVKCIKGKDYYVKCPSSETWECKPKNCDFDECPNPIEYIEVGPDEPFCSNCKKKIKQNPNTKKKTVPAFRRNQKLFCKSEICTQACIDDWRYKIDEL